MTDRDRTVRVDAHHHVWDLAAVPQPWTAGSPVLARSFSFDELREDLVAAEVDATVVVQTAADAAETAALLRLAESEPLVAGVVGWADLADPDVAQHLARLRDGQGGGRLVGLRHSLQDLPGAGWLGSPAAGRGLAALVPLGLAVDLLVRPDQLLAAAEAAARHPGVRFVLDHAGRPDLRAGLSATWRDGLRQLARQENVAVKLSGLTAAAGPGWSPDLLRPCVAEVLGAFGPGRTMVGSDWPVCLETATYADVVGLALSLTDGLGPEEREAVLGGTAASWYRLTGVGVPSSWAPGARSVAVGHTPPTSTPHPERSCPA